ncbi:L-lactate dehydrogenase complex protein LldG [Actinokineospora alba]|uniref:L-lactate dehydrogenase complex protein LldG n=1 Tax=Actinokineospora alba TaxID=504798 RepID=A0A1H0ESX7_9PSEU|nr:lactate utilization protein C [Actinokineospora alba]TDP69212.1 L-lactate dehydrogenase complex protein LldG [Actinokineospora alba]SDI21766.1 L-lactate dehydrogenase complex protein LldG [Actinokineospora alba]SDN85472.1 L-lactate dehydrogenase complex protein LldG [Actinokineospora alba]
MTAREEILGRIRSALSTVDKAEIVVSRDYQQAIEGDLVGLFAERVADYRAAVVRTTADTVPEAIAEQLAHFGIGSVVTPADLPADWVPQAVTDAPPLDVPALDAADGVVTACAVGIAETGTIVLDAGPGQSRRALTLVPDFHLCVVRTDQIVGTVPEAIARLDGTRPLTWISGPSATSDIELNRVEGVHGPRTLVVLIVG